MSERLSGRQWLIILTASAGAMLEVVDVSITNVALLHIQASLGATLAEVGWVVTGYAMASVVVIPLSGWLTALLGQRRYFLLSLLGFTAASLLCGLAPNLPLLVVARLLQGGLGGGLMPMAQAILFRSVPRSLQGMAQGVFGLVVLVGPAIGPTLGGVLTDDLGWRWVFFINLPLGLLTALLALATFPAEEGRRSDGPGPLIDGVGITLLVVSLASIQVVLEQGRQLDWFAAPLIRQLTLLALVAGCLFSFVLGIGLYGTVFVVPLFAQSQLHQTATQTGLLMLPGALASPGADRHRRPFDGADPAAAGHHRTRHRRAVAVLAPDGPGHDHRDDVPSPQPGDPRRPAEGGPGGRQRALQPLAPAGGKLRHCGPHGGARSTAVAAPGPSARAPAAHRSAAAGAPADAAAARQR